MYKGKDVLIVSHKNTLRALFMQIKGLSEEACKKIAVPNAIPIIYEFDDEMRYLRNYELEELTSTDESEGEQLAKLPNGFESEWMNEDVLIKR